jgi:dihydrolipoamide dehydrogenase
MRYRAVPWVVYTIPEGAGVGLTEAQAEEEGRKIKTATMQMRANGRFLAENGNKKNGICKVIADEDSGVLLGVHLLGGVCSEIIHGAAAMIEAELRIKDIKEIIFPHPTVSEIIKDTVWQL